MNRRIVRLSPIGLVLALFCLVPSLGLMAQDTRTQQGFADQDLESDSRPPHRRYILKDVGTFGGPSSTLPFEARILNNRGTVVGGADTSIPDPYNGSGFNFPNPFVQHAFKWRNNVLTDLGTLPGSNSSFAGQINDRGQIIGTSQTDLIDPFTSAPGTAPVLWQNNGEIVNLGSFGGNEGFATGINNSGQVIGAAANTIPDPFSLIGLATQTRAFLWQRGVMRDLGTLGGPDAIAAYINEGGQVTGVSYTNSTPNDTTGIPTEHPFLWENGRMTDLGSLGGTLSFPSSINSRGQIIGFMTLPGDESQHPFLWDRGRLTDLGTFGGNNGEANWMNDAGEVVGYAFFPGDMLRRAFVWRHGVKKDLGPPPGYVCTNAFGINSEGQVVGTAGICHGAVHAVLWENGRAIDLNSVIPHNSSLQLVNALSINDRGEIAGVGVPPGVSPQDVGTLGHVFLLIPADGNHAEEAAEADSSLDPQAKEAGQDDSESTTAITHSDASDAVAGVKAVNESQIPGRRFGRLSRFPLGRSKDN